MKRKKENVQKGEMKSIIVDTNKEKNQKVADQNSFAPLSLIEEAEMTWDEGKLMGLCSEEDDALVINMLVDLNIVRDDECGGGKGIDTDFN